MKFDAAYVNATFEKLGDPVFAGPDGEGRIADYVAGELERMGWSVERREVRGPRFPQRAAPFVGWLGYLGLISVAFAVLSRGILVGAFAAFFILVFATNWALGAATGTTIRVGRRVRPLAAAPLLIAQTPTDSRPAIRVVFQAVLGGIRTDLFHSLGVNRMYAIAAQFLFWFLVFATPAILLRAGSRERAVMAVAIISFFLVFLWLVALFVLCRHSRRSWLAEQTGEVDRWGLTTLIELARGWPRNRSQRIEPVFVAAGGQRLDFAGSREVLRMLDSEWPRKPSLLVLLFAPGAGERLRPSENPLRITGLYQRETDLAKEAAASLWIPVHSKDHFSLFFYWPFEKSRVESIALLGSRPGANYDAAVSPEVLQRATQLATEIALRWAKQKGAQVASSRASTTKPEGPNELGVETP